MQAGLSGAVSVGARNSESYCEQKTNGGTERLHPIEWSGSDAQNCFWFCDGTVECKNPSESWIAKMVELARKLDAQVLGEEDEEYI